MSVLEPLKLTYPIFQAPTGSIAGPELCAAVSKAGALGAMGLTWTQPEVAREQIQHVKALTERPFQVNFVLHFAPLSLEVALKEGVPVITFSWGDPTEWIPIVHKANAIVGVQVTGVAGARRMKDAGADFLICQGIEAGGHVQSTTLLFDLLPQVIAVAGETPVVAAGGLADRDDIERALSAGASAVMLGTRFVATQESRAHATYKAALQAATAEQTALTTCFDQGWPYAAHRVLRNSTFTEWEANGCPKGGERPGENDLLAHTETGVPIYRYEDTAPRVGMAGNIEAMCLYAGTSVAKIHDLPTVAELIKALQIQGRA